MADKRYLVSALVSTYNSERFIRGCLEDLVSQTLADKLEIVIVNDGSEQDEESIVREFQQRHSNIKYIRADHRGVAAAYNRAIQEASGEYLIGAATDDRHSPEMLERLARELDHRPEIDVVYPHYYVTPIENQSWYTKTPVTTSSWIPPYSRDELLKWFFLGPFLMWRKSLHDEYGYLDEYLKVSNDYEFFLRASQTHKFLLIPEPLGLYNFRLNSLERSAGSRDDEDMLVWALYQNNGDRIIRRPLEQLRTTVFVVANGDPSFTDCLRALNLQAYKDFRVTVIRNPGSLRQPTQEMINRCQTEFFIALDETIMLNTDAVGRMEAYMDAAPENVGMISLLLRDIDRDKNVEGVKIYRTRHIKNSAGSDLKSGELDLIEQLPPKNVQWTLHPEIIGLRTRACDPETIYRRYKSSYERDIDLCNVLDGDIKKNADKYRETGDPLRLFAILGAAHGIINGHRHKNGDAAHVNGHPLREVELFKRLLLAKGPCAIPYDPFAPGRIVENKPIPLDQVKWRHEPRVTAHSSKQCLEKNADGSLVSTPASWRHELRWLERKLAFTPVDPAIYLEMATILIDRGQINEAKKILAEGSKLDPNHALMGMLTKQCAPLDDSYGEIGFFSQNNPQTNKYACAHEWSRPWEYFYVARTLDEIDIDAKTVVDIGIGFPSDSDFSNFYLGSNCSLLAFDLDPRLDDVTILTDRCVIFKKSAEQMDVPSNSVNVVVAISSLEQFPADVFLNTIKEIHRVLKSDGHLIITLHIRHDKQKPADWAVLEKTLNGRSAEESVNHLDERYQCLTLEYFLDLISPYFYTPNTKICNQNIDVSDAVYSEELNSRAAYLHLFKK